MCGAQPLPPGAWRDTDRSDPSGILRVSVSTLGSPNERNLWVILNLPPSLVTFKEDAQKMRASPPTYWGSGSTRLSAPLQSRAPLKEFAQSRTNCRVLLVSR